MVRAMPARQLWAFLTERDVQELIGQIAAREPGLAVSQGRYLRGDPAALLRDPRALERRDSLPGERRLYLLHAKYSADVVTHLQPAGPFVGWSQIDEEKTDCIVLRLKNSPAGELEPARIYAHVTYWRAADKARKRTFRPAGDDRTHRAEMDRGEATADFGADDPDRRRRIGAGERRSVAAHVPVPDHPAVDPVAAVPTLHYTSRVRYPSGFSSLRSTGSATLTTGTPPRVAPRNAPRWAWPWMARFGRS